MKRKIEVKLSLGSNNLTTNDAPSSSLIDSITSLKWKHQKDKELGYVPWFITLQGLKGVLELRDGDSDEWQAGKLFTITCTNQTTSWLMHSWNTFGAWTNNG
jgi:hypothetical protein